MSNNQTFVTRFLREYHSSDPIDSEERMPLGKSEITYLVEAGLGPILYSMYGEPIRSTDPESFLALRSADLTARAIYGQLEQSTCELLLSLQRAGITPVLLKGISTANEFYSPSYLRLMGDIDILVRPSDGDIAMKSIAKLGYKTTDSDWALYRKKGHHHLPEARHSATGISIEIHTALFAPGRMIANELVFQLPNLEKQRRLFEYNGIPAAKFSPEFQLIYSISHWGVDANWALHLTSVNDVVHIIRRYEKDFDWTLLERWLSENPWLFPTMLALTTYISRSEIINIPPPLLHSLSNCGHKVEPTTMKVLNWLLHNYPFNAPLKRRSDNAIAGTRVVWQDLTKPYNRDFMIPLSFLRGAIRYAYVGKFNPLRWISYLYRLIRGKLRSRN